MLSLRKISQQISEETVSWIPLPPLDRLWNNLNTYKYFGLTKIQIKQIEDHISNFTGNKLSNTELNTFKNAEHTYEADKQLIGIDKLKQTEGTLKVDKLDYILNNVYKVNISYQKFENKLVELGVIAKYIPKLWQKFYINKQ